MVTNVVERVSAGLVAMALGRPTRSIFSVLPDYSRGCLARCGNIAYLRAQTGGGMSRLNFASESISSMETNLRAAIGRIEDVDIAAESANLAKYSILTQASAAMIAQANSTSDVALMLLR